MTDSIRTDIAHVVSAALAAEGHRGIPARSALAVADAILVRPGMLRAAVAGSAVHAPHTAAEDALAMMDPPRAADATNPRQL